jgi:cyclopropane fatty-acyl-phospholipid synthase-like methyltransferase
MSTLMHDIYGDGTYLENNPGWHQEDSPWKARNIAAMLQRNGLKPTTVCEIGCGAGEVLRQLSMKLDPSTRFAGYEVSPQAFAICNEKSTSNLTFHLENLLDKEDASFELVMALDVFEHVEDYFTFLRKMRPMGTFKLFHIPLDLSAQSVLRGTPIIAVRRSLGHLHYFTKDTALASLEECGYTIVDHVYTAGGLDLAAGGWKRKLARLPRRLLFAASPDFAARLLGGFSLLVLAR